MQSFLAVAETGSLSAAATELSVSQPTLGRHIKTLEDTLGVPLFDRHTKGLRLTTFGRDLIPHAEQMRALMSDIALRAEAERGTLSGTVRIACSIFAAHHVLPSVISDLRQAATEISIVLIASDDSENLLFAQADIAVRMYRPEQLELITRHIGDIPMAAFAARSYVQRRGRPDSPEALADHEIVGFDKNTLILDTMRQMGFDASEDMFAVRCDNQTAYWQLVRAGCGIGFTQAHTGQDDPLVEELHLGLDIPALPIWLAAHPSARKTPRVDRVWQHLCETLPRVIGSR